MAEMSNDKMKWSSSLEFYVSLVGYSIGMPEFWRVPYLTYRNGGGTFIIAYILLMLICGLPLYFIELALSQYSGKGPWRIWDICPLLRGIAVGTSVINAICSVYAVIFTAWIVEYFTNSFRSTLPWTTCVNEWNTDSCYSPSKNYSSAGQTTNFTNLTVTSKRPVEPVDEFWLYKVLNISSGIDVIGALSGLYVLYMLILRILTALSIAKSVQTLGKVLMVTALLPIILVIVMWIRALTLPGSIEGMKLFITPKWAKFADQELWTEAAFQTFITLGPGWGGLMMLGCHNKFHSNIIRSSVIGTVSTLTFGILNGLVVFSVLGVMAEELGVPIDSVVTSGGFSIAFIAYPKALSYFPLPQVWCVIFYLLLLLPGFDMMAILTEPFILVIEELFPGRTFTRRYVLLTIYSIVTFLLGLPFATEAGIYMFILLDWFVGTWSITLICLAECIAFAWIYGGHRIDRDMRLMVGRGLPALIRIGTAFVVPVFLSILLSVSIFTYRSPSFGTYKFPGYANAIGWCFAMASIVPSILYSVSLVVKEKGSLTKRMKVLTKYLPSWGPADEKTKHIFYETEHSANFSWKELFIFNLTGNGELDTTIKMQSLENVLLQQPVLNDDECK